MPASGRTIVRHLWRDKTMSSPYLRYCKPLNLQVPADLFRRLIGVSQILAIQGHDSDFGLVRDLGHGICDRDYHFVFGLVEIGSGRSMRPTRLVVCGDDIEVTDSEADIRLSRLHSASLIERAARIASEMLIRAPGSHTGHDLLRDQAWLRRAADEAIRRYRRPR